MLFGQRNRWRVSSICMIMSSLSGFSILAGTICKQTLLETCYLIWCVKRQGSWYKKLYDTSIAILVMPCNRALTEDQVKVKPKYKLKWPEHKLIYLVLFHMYSPCVSSLKYLNSRLWLFSVLFIKRGGSGIFIVFLL